MRHAETRVSFGRRGKGELAVAGERWVLEPALLLEELPSELERAVDGQGVHDVDLKIDPLELLDGVADEIQVHEEVAQVTRQILAELPDIFRTVLVMREFEERPYQEIADILGISIGTVESRLFRARARFRERLLKDHPEFCPGGGE